jgi:hypothetical protein
MIILVGAMQFFKFKFRLKKVRRIKFRWLNYVWWIWQEVRELVRHKIEELDYLKVLKLIRVYWFWVVVYKH